MIGNIMLKRIFDKLISLNFIYILIFAVACSELLTIIMSYIFRGEIALEYVITGGVVSLLATSILMYFIKNISEISEINVNLEREIAERKRVEEKLKNALDEWRRTVDSTTDMIVMLDSDLKVLKVNRAVAKFFRMPLSSIMENDYVKLVENSRVKHDTSLVMNMKESRSHEYGQVYVSEQNVWLAISIDPVLNEDYALTGGVLIMRDITELKEMENSIFEAKVEWEESFNIINDAITIYDQDFNVIRSNKAADEIMYSPYLTDKKDSKDEEVNKYYEQGLVPLRKALETGLPQITEIYEPLLKKYFEIKALPRFDKDNNCIGLIRIVRDITAKINAYQEQKKLQADLAQVQKLESVGRLAGGIAHDFNNTLTSILGFSDLSLTALEQMKKIDEKDCVIEYIKVIFASGEKGVALVDQLLAFSRKQALKPIIVDLYKVVIDVAKMLERIIGKHINIKINCSGKARHIKADPIQMEQIIMNLVINARDAMPGGGNLIIDVSEVVLDKEYTKNIEGIEPGNFINLKVSDTGEGIPKDIIDNIFEPFFTSKKQGQGTGLGLSTVYGIVKQHNGHISVSSEEGRGTEFNIYIPACEAPEPEVVEMKELQSIPTGSETIMFVDDEPTIRKLIVNTLEPLGYNLLEAENGYDAIHKSNVYEGDVHLLLTDVVMPGLGGKQTVKIMKEKRPNTKIILMSGHYMDETVGNLISSDIVEAFIKKPLTPSLIARKVRDVLDR